MLLVAYDIPDDHRRLKAMKLLDRIGRRVQYSVFAVEDLSAEAVATMLRKVLSTQEDNVRVHVMCATCIDKAVLLGVARQELDRLGFRVI